MTETNIPQNSYYDGTGRYQSLYSTVVAKFPQYPNRYNTTPTQNFLGIVASTYMAYHDHQTHPHTFVNDWIYRYFLDPKVEHLLKDILAAATPQNTHAVLNRLLDEAIIHEHHNKPIQALIKKLGALRASL